MRYLIPTLLLAFLVGCAMTPEERAARQQEKAREIVSEYGPACSELGHEPGTTGFSDCVVRLYSAEQQRRAAAAGVVNAAQQGFKQASEPFGY